jgi:hypothetical protein
MLKGLEKFGMQNLRLSAIVGVCVGAAAALGQDVSWVSFNCVPRFVPDPFYLAEGFIGNFIYLGIPVGIAIAIASMVLLRLFPNSRNVLRSWKCILALVVAVALMAAIPSALNHLPIAGNCDL